MRLLLALFALCPSLSSSFAQAEVTLTFGGDMNFNPSREAPRPDGVMKSGNFYAFKDLFAGIRPLLDGNINFANLETTVSSQTKLVDTGGQFVFASHPNAVVAAAEAGINLFNLANNHIGDHGLVGMQDTLANLGELARDFPVHMSGLGANREAALVPAVFEVKDGARTYHIALMSVTAISNTPAQADAHHPGTLYLKDERDFNDALAAMAAVQADYKILSIHGGTEGSIVIDAWQRTAYEGALERGDLDLILGHHPHRPRAVQRIGHKIIFYSLGNYLMLGAADIDGLPANQDFGLYGKLHLEWDPSLKRLVAQAAEAVPLLEMERVPHPYDRAGAARRIDDLNALGQGELKESALMFRVDERGYGVSCLGKPVGLAAARICNPGN